MVREPAMRGNKTKPEDKSWLPVLVLMSATFVMPIIQFILMRIRSKRDMQKNGHEKPLAKPTRDGNDRFTNNSVLDQPAIESKQIEPSTPRKIGEAPHFPHYNVRIAAQSYSNIGAILAGFALAAMILVIQNTHPPQKSPEAADLATIAFLIAFFGCITSAFVFSVVSGEEILAHRTNMVAVFGGMGFSISANLIFWGLVTLTKLFLDESISNLAIILYVVFSFIQPAFLGFSALDNIYMFPDKGLSHYSLAFRPKPTPAQWRQVLIPSYIPIFIAILIRILLYLIGFLVPTPPLATVLRVCAVVLTVGIILISCIAALIVSDKDFDFDLSPQRSGLLILSHSIVIGLLIVII